MNHKKVKRFRIKEAFDVIYDCSFNRLRWAEFPKSLIKSSSYCSRYFVSLAKKKIFFSSLSHQAFSASLIGDVKRWKLFQLFGQVLDIKKLLMELAGGWCAKNVVEWKAKQKVFSQKFKLVSRRYKSEAKGEIYRGDFGNENHFLWKYLPQSAMRWKP